MLTRSGESDRDQLLGKKVEQLMTVRVSSSGHKLANWLSNSKWSTQKSYSNKQQYICQHVVYYK